MGCCCGGDPATTSETKGIVRHRSCTDVVCLLVFVAFWVGMVIVCITAVSEGDYNRLVYGFDSQGFLCGTNNEFADGEKGPDFTNRKRLYYLNALDLLDPSNFKAARSICVEECPGPESECGLSEICTESEQFRCPYYRVGEDNIYGTLADTDQWSTSYFSNLGTTSSTGCGDLVGGIPDSVLDAFGASSTSTSCGQYYQMKSLYPNQGPCYPVYTDTVEYFNRCFPRFTDEIQAILEDQLNINNEKGTNWKKAVSSLKDEFGGTGERLQRYIGDITKGWMIIVVAGLVVAIVLSLVWMIVLRYFAGVMAWATIFLVNIFFIGFTLLAYERSGLLGEAGEIGKKIAEQIPKDQDPTEGDRKIWKIVAIVASVLSALLLLLTLLMIKRIKIAVAVIKVASQAMSTMPSLLFFPIIPFILEAAVVLYFVFVSALLYSAGDLTPMRKTSGDILNLNHLLGDNNVVPDFLQTDQNGDMPVPIPANITREECAMDSTCYYGIKWNDTLKYMFLYHLFGILWTTQFIVGFGYVVIAGSVASFYWTRGNSHEMPLSPVLTSVRRTLCYHLGSIAVGSFIVAVVQFIRIILEFIDRKSKKLQESTHPAVKYIMACLKCFLWCLENILKFINRNAYIMVAVKGTNFCTSAGRAVALIVQNVLRLAAVNIVGDVLMWLGKLTIMAGSGCAAFFLADIEYYTDEEKYPDTFLSSPLMPIIISLLVGYAVADLFFQVYEMAIDTILLSFCEDCETNNGNPTFAPPLLLAAIGQAKKQVRV